MQPGTNFNHPEAGSCIIVEPIRRLEDIAAIRELLKNKPRDLCLFTLGINTNLRVGDLLSLKVRDVAYLEVGDEFIIRQQKRKKYGIRSINSAVHNAIRRWIRKHPNSVPSAPLFPGKDAARAITVPYASRLIKRWCKDIGLKGNYAAHSLRKTFGYHAWKTFGRPLPVITAAFNHSSQAVTLSYLCIQDDDVSDLFMNVL